jgi:hypothetical protein
MKSNCGIIAYDGLVGKLNGRTNNISLDTLAKIAQDNGFILFPMRATKDDLDKLKFPFILHSGHHFELWEKKEDVNLPSLTEPFYVLSSQCVTDLVVSEEEAKGVKGGGRGKQWYDLAGTNPLGMGKFGSGIVDAGTAILGNMLLPGLGTAASTALGGVQGYGKGGSGGLGGTLLGAAGGYGSGALGTSIGAGLQAIPSGGLGAFLPAAGSAMGSYGINPQISQVLGGVGNALGLGSGATSATGAGSAFGSTGGIGSGLGTLPTMGTGASATSPLLSGLVAPATATTAAGTAAGSGGGLLSSGLLKNLMGPGLLASSMLPQNPSFQMPSSVADLRSRVATGAVTPVGQANQAEIQRIINSPLSQVYPDSATSPEVQSQLDLLEKAKQKDIETLQKQAATFGSPYGGEITGATQNLMDTYAGQENALTTQAALNMQNQEVNAKLTAMSQASGIDQTSMSELAGLTGLDVEAVATKYGVDVSTVNQLRQLLGTAGTLGLAGSLGLFGGK